MENEVDKRFVVINMVFLKLKKGEYLFEGKNLNIVIVTLCLIVDL